MLLVVFVLLDLQFYVFCRSLFVLLSLFAIVLFVLLRFTDSDYPFGIFKLFLHQRQVKLVWKVVHVRWIRLFKEGKVCDPINRFNLATYVCLSQTGTWEFQLHMSWSFLCSVSYVERWLFVLFIFVELVDHQCLNFLLIMFRY